MKSVEKKDKVFVGLSGGVDSSVAAALLQKRGYEVVGVFIKIWDAADDWGVKCTWREERRDAMRVAARLDIPLLTLDLTREYKRSVVDYMIAEYRAGRTPNPDVMCNRQIKFGAFFNWARWHDADYVATGHYVRGDHLTPSPSPKERGVCSSFSLPFGEGLRVGWRLRIAADPAKDQSYFLWTLTQAELRHCLFPIGDYQKSEVRRLAKKFGLSTADKKDSQGLCFIGDWNLKDFLRRYIKPKKGNVLNESGAIIGEHEGAWYYTSGERRGFTITQKTSADKPYYVVAKDVEKNQLIVGHAGTPGPAVSRPGSKLITLADVNWISGVGPTADKIYQAQIRYRGKLYRCRLSLINNQTKLIFLDLPEAIALGQSAVIYDGEIMLGGGVIDAILPLC